MFFQQDYMLLYPALTTILNLTAVSLYTASWGM